MRSWRVTILIGTITSFMLLNPAAAQADPDTDFAKALQAIGIYGQKDYNAWIAKITCERLQRGVDQDAVDSATFVSMQLTRGSTTEQAWQFLGLAYPAYCPQHYNLLIDVAAERPN